MVVRGEGGGDEDRGLILSIEFFNYLDKPIIFRTKYIIITFRSECILTASR